MNNWILEKQGQLKLFLLIVIILLTASTAQTEDKIRPYTDNKGEKVYTNEKLTQQTQNNQKLSMPLSELIKQHGETIKKLEEQQNKINIPTTFKTPAITAPDFNNLTTELTRITALAIGINLIILSPILIVFSQLALAIRETTLNTRKEFNSETEYKTLYWITTILFFLGWCLIPIGAILVIQAI